MNVPPWMQVPLAQLTIFGLKILGAIAIWIIGRRLITLAVNLTMGAARRQAVDETLLGCTARGSRSSSM